MDPEIFGFDFAKKYDYENGYYLTSDVSRIGKCIAHYELYKKTLGLCGHVVECGVYKGASLIRFASFRELLESQYARKIIAFDMFGRFPRTGRPEDDKFIEQFEEVGGQAIGMEELAEIFEQKGFVNYELVRGNLTETIDGYLHMHPELKISLLHIDVDVYHATKMVLRALYGRVVRGGIIVLDDYGCVEGATTAVDEFIEEKELTCKIEKFPFYSVPAYIVK